MDTEKAWGDFIGTTYEPSSWEILLNDLMCMGGTHIIYRGQGESEWPLTCTLVRRIIELEGEDSHLGLLLKSAAQSDELEDFIHRSEIRMLRIFMDRTAEFGIPDLPAQHDRLAWWEMMQHHKAPTRLMDWTASPFIGLWFAMSDSTDEKDAALWIFDKRNSFINHQKEIIELDREVSDARTWQNRLADNAIANRSQVPVVMETSRSLSRAVAQKSVMTLIPYPGSSFAMGAYLFSQLAVKVLIPIAWRPSIARALDSMGISRSSPFMDLDSTGVDLSRTLGL